MGGNGVVDQEKEPVVLGNDGTRSGDPVPVWEAGARTGRQLQR